MIRKNLLFIALFTIIAFAAGCGGNGSGTSSKPDGVNAGVPSVVQLLPIQTIVQTNSQIDIKAKILDGNGNPVSNVPVTFINLSPIGTFVAGPEATPSEAQEAVSNIVLTDYHGFATIKVWSPQEGFLTILVEINVGQGQVRDKQTIFFTSSDTLRITPSMTLDVDAEGDGSWNNQPPNPPFDDFILLEAPGDDTVLIRATVKSGIGLPVAFSTVTFGADRAYRIGMDPTAACSDGSAICDITFISGNVVTTDPAGQATVTLQVTPEALNSIQTLFNVTAVADNGAAGIVTLFIDPVTIALVAISANPTVVEPGATSDITAFVTTNLGGIAPDDTAVMFYTAPTTGTDPNPCGSIDPFAQTTLGSADATFIAPFTEGDCTVTAISNGAFDTVIITVAGPPLGLAVFPTSQEVDGSVGDPAVTYTIFGGVAPYDVFTNDPLFPPVPTTVLASGGTFTVTVSPGTAPTTVTYTVLDSLGAIVTATLIISDTTGPSVTLTTPANGGNGPVDGNITIVWDESIDCATVNTTNVTISGTGGPTLTLFSCSGTTAVFSVLGQVGGNLYLVNVSAAVTDVVGNPMTTAYSFSYSVP